MRWLAAWHGPALDARLAHILDLFGEDSRRNVHAGELEVRPPGAPTTPGMLGGGGPPAERRGVLGAVFAYRPIRRTDRSARPEMILKPLGRSAKSFSLASMCS